MEFINTVLGTPLGYIIYFAYLLTGSYGLSVLLFAVVVRVAVLFPVSILAHKNSIRLLQITPSLSVIRRRYAGDKERLNEEQHELFKNERYSPFVGLIPLLVQLLLIIGIMQVMLNPLRHMHGISEDAINFVFMGLDLRIIPSLLRPSPELVMLLLSGGSALGFCLVQNALSPGALSQSRGTNLFMTLFTIALSLYLALALPVGVGLYWTASNVVAIGMVFLLNLMYNPKKLAPEALSYLKSIEKAPAERRAEREIANRLRARGKRDAAKFAEAKKQLVFYAISGGQYKYYKTVIDYILANSDIVIHYLTNDPDDAVFGQEHPRLIPYYADQRKTISLMLKLDADMLVTTVPDLQSYHMKRSIVRDDIEYVYIFHAPISTSIQYRERAFDYFDTIFCVGPHHVTELRRREEIANLPRRNLVKAGYGMYDVLLESVAGLSGEKRDKPRILIAPSWQKDNILETCIDSVLEALQGCGYEIIIRPHPQFTQLFKERLDDLERRYADPISKGEFNLELDSAKNSSIFTSDLLITDWSGIAYEFSYCTSRPCVFINTPQKITNPEYTAYGIAPMEITVRDKVGISMSPADIPEKLSASVSGLLGEQNENDLFSAQIKSTLAEYIYHPGRSGEAGGKYVMSKLISL